MFTTILVPLDGSERAETALPLAVRIARRSGAALLLVRVISFAASSWAATFTTNPLVAQAVIEADMREAGDYLQRVAASPQLKGLTVRTQLPHGHAASTIIELAVSSQSDLIVLCRTGASGLARWAMGGTATKVVRHAAAPVLVVPGDRSSEETVPADPARPLRMLIPLDGSTYAQAALEPGAELLTALSVPGQKSVLHLAQVVPTPQERDDTWGRGALSQAEAAMADTITHLREGSLAPWVAQHRLPVTWSVLPDADVASALLRVAEVGEDAGGCQLIAITTHGRGGVQRWIMGSVAERVLSAATRPVLIVHPATIL